MSVDSYTFDGRQVVSRKCRRCPWRRQWTRRGGWCVETRRA